MDETSIKKIFGCIYLFYDAKKDIDVIYSYRGKKKKRIRAGKITNPKE